MSFKVDILAMMAHPDDAELSCGGTLLISKRQGHTTGIVDLTKGELGTRGTPQIRQQEAEEAAAKLGLNYRGNLNLSDGFFKDDEQTRFKVIASIRSHQPSIIITNSRNDRHPDHGRAAKLVSEASWLSGLSEVKTHDEDGNLQPKWRPKRVLYAEQYKVMKPDLVVDIADVIEEKMNVILCYKSQFYNQEADSSEEETFISRKNFLDIIKRKAAAAGNYAMIQYGECFQTDYTPAITNLFELADTLEA